MNEIILGKLAEIEEKENVKILHCVESGSRAWGFASPDSDYDVRFIYVRPKEYYLKLEKTRDVIEWQLDEVLDINGWDIQKMLRLLHNSNPTVFEWMRSPIVYKTTPQWQKITEVIMAYFQIKPALYHYLSTAKSTFLNHLQGDEVKLKKYFYVLRPLLACEWILKNNEPAPMLFSDLMTQEIDCAVRDEIENLLRIKTAAGETEKGQKNEILSRFIEEKTAQTEETVRALPNIEQKDWKELDDCFLSLLNI